MSKQSGGRFWVLLAVILAGFWCASGWALLELRRDSYAIAMAGSRNLLAVLSQDIESSLSAYDRILSGVTAKLDGSKLVALGPDAQQRYLFDEALVKPYFTSLLVLDAAGNVVRDAGAFPHRTENFSDRDYFQAQRDSASLGLFVSRPFQRRLTGDDLVIALSRRIERPDGSFAGVAVGTVRLDYFKDLLKRAHLQPRDAINLFSTSGVLLMRMPFREDQIGRDLSGTENVQHFIRDHDGSFSGVAAVDGVRRVYTFSHVGNLPLILNVALDEEAIYAGWRTRAAQIAGVLVLLSILAITLGLRMRRELIRRTKAEAVALKAEAAALRNETQYRLLADNATDMIVRLDHTLTRRYVSPACRSVLGYEAEELVGHRSRDLIHPDDWPVVEGIVTAARETGEPAEATYRLRHRTGRDVWVEGRYGYMPGEDGFLVVLRDISKRKAAEVELEKAHAELRDLAGKDGLTGLANRRRFDDVLAHACEAASVAGGSLSLLLLDVDHFKRFNDRYGHQAGDECLRRVAEAVAGCVRSNDLVARYGGEEFAVVLPHADDVTARAVAERIGDAVRQLAIGHEGNRDAGAAGVVTVSLGCTTYGPGSVDAVTPDELVRRADATLYEAKRTGRDRVIATSDMPSDPTAPIGPREEQRLEAVSRVRTRLLDDDRVATLNAMARDAAGIMNAPVGFVSLVGAEDVWLIGREGIDAQVVPRDIAFCSHTITGWEPMIVEDLKRDPRFAQNPLVAGEPNLRFYAGAPLLDPGEGLWLGAVCAIGPEVLDSPTAAQRDALKRLSQAVADCLK